jgi:hypothetical protein
MDPIKKSTKAAIKAALGAYYGEIDEAARKNCPSGASEGVPGARMSRKCLFRKVRLY